MADPLTPGDVEHEDDRDRREREQERELERERYGPPTTHCQTCGKPLEAQLTCPACGDEDVEQAEVSRSRSFAAASLGAPPAERPAVWIRPDLSGLADVFGGSDEGWGRRAEDRDAA